MLFLHMVMTIHSMLRTHPEVDLNNVKCNTSKSRLARLQAYCMHLGPGTWETRLLYWFGRHFADTHMYTPMLPDLTASYLIAHRTVPNADLDVDFVACFDLRYLGARALCAQSPGVFVNIRWNLSLPNPVRVKTSLTLTFTYLTGCRVTLHDDAV